LCCNIDVCECISQTKICPFENHAIEITENPDKMLELFVNERIAKTLYKGEILIGRVSKSYDIALIEKLIKEVVVGC